jgi:hypothetical protein
LAIVGAWIAFSGIEVAVDLDQQGGPDVDRAHEARVPGVSPRTRRLMPIT